MIVSVSASVNYEGKINEVFIQYRIVVRSLEYWLKCLTVQEELLHGRAIAFTIFGSTRFMTGCCNLLS